MTCADCKSSSLCNDNRKAMFYDKDGNSRAEWCYDFNPIWHDTKATYMGYTAYQTSYNFHVKIFDEVGKMVCHVPCDKMRSEDELIDMIKIYMIAAKQLEKIWEDDEDD